MSDAELLQSYVEKGSQRAFEELVNRHVNLVFSTALRLMNGDVSAAQDVAQNVFADLARKAPKLGGYQVLTGWLYTSTRFAAAKAVRAEQTRRRYEQEAQTMSDPSNRSLPEANWAELRPVLDDVMSK